MNIVICQQGTFSLEEPDRFDAFKIVVKAPSDGAHIRTTLAELGDVVDESHVWVDSVTLVERSGFSDDPSWLAGFDKMVSLGRKYGFVQGEPVKIRAHIEWQNGA